MGSSTDTLPLGKNLIDFVKSKLVVLGFRRTKLILGVFILTSGLLGLLRFDIMQVGGSVDDAQYVVLAQSLANGQGYRLINFPDSSPVPHAISFPPGWPLLLSSMAVLFPGEYEVWKLLAFALWLASIPLAYRLFRSRLESPYLWVLTALIATNSLLVATSTMLMAEAAYVFFSLLALNLFQYWDNRNGEKSNWLLLAVIAVAAVYTQLVRTIGLAAVLAVLSALLLSRRFRQLLLMAGFMLLAMVPQILFNMRTGGFLFSDHYEQASLGSSSLPGKMYQAWEQLLGYADGHIVDSIIPIFRPALITPFENAGLEFIPALVNVFILGFILVGVVRSLRQLNIWDLYVGFYFMGILAFRAPEMGIVQPRFLIPLIPFFYFYLITGLVFVAEVVSGKNEKWVKLTVAAMATVVFLLSLGLNLQSWRAPVRTRTTDLTVGTHWISENTPADSIVMLRDPIPRYIYTQRKTLGYPSPEQGLDLGGHIENLGIDYVLVAPRLQTPRTRDLGQYVTRHLGPYLDTHPERYRIVFRNAEHNVTVYEVVRENPRAHEDGG